MPPRRKRTTRARSRCEVSWNLPCCHRVLDHAFHGKTRDDSGGASRPPCGGRRNGTTAIRLLAQLESLAQRGVEVVDVLRALEGRIGELDRDLVKPLVRAGAQKRGRRERIGRGGG